MTDKKSIHWKSSNAELPITQLLSRIAAILLRLGLDSPRSESLLRRAFVTAAQVGRSRLTQTMLASITGLSRLEVRRILRGQRRTESKRVTRIDDLLLAWRSDPHFLDARGKPRLLDLRGGRGSFERLVKRYGRDITARTMREELVRKGYALVKKGKIGLAPIEDTVSYDVSAAKADVKFLASHLASIDFELGKRVYASRQSSISVENNKRVEMVKRIAVQRLETVLNSLAAMSSETTVVQGKQTKGRSRRVMVTAIVTTESEDKRS